MDDVNVLVTFYSRTGLTERLAVWIAEGAIQAGAKIRLRRARDLMPPEVISRFPEWAENGERMDKEYAAPRVPMPSGLMQSSLAHRTGMSLSAPN